MLRILYFAFKTLKYAVIFLFWSFFIIFIARGKHIKIDLFNILFSHFLRGFKRLDKSGKLCIEQKNPIVWQAYREIKHNVKITFYMDYSNILHHQKQKSLLNCIYYNWIQFLRHGSIYWALNTVSFPQWHTL